MIRSSGSLEILCLVLAALVLVWSGSWTDNRGFALAVLIAFGAAIALFRAPQCLPAQPRLKLQIESWTMVVFITAVLWISGKGESPMQNLYLLPLIMSALTLGRRVTMLQLALIAACQVALAAATPGLDVFSAQYAGRAVGELAPFVLVAYFTATLSADITEAREHIENLAQKDVLTGIYNARTFSDVLQREHASCERRRGIYALLMLDMDRLKDINEDFGHEAGNSAIVLVAQCLQRSIRATDIPARLGGDEFAALLPGASPDIAEAVIKRVRHNVYKTTLDLRSRMVRCSVSIGVVNYPGDGRDLHELQSLAERNMYRDKTLRRVPGARVKA